MTVVSLDLSRHRLLESPNGGAYKGRENQRAGKPKKKFARATGTKTSRAGKKGTQETAKTMTNTELIENRFKNRKVQGRYCGLRTSEISAQSLVVDKTRHDLLRTKELCKGAAFFEISS